MSNRQFFIRGLTVMGATALLVLFLAARQSRAPLQMRGSNILTNVKDTIRASSAAPERDFEMTNSRSSRCDRCLSSP
jgi:hypothetical protein